MTLAAPQIGKRQLEWDSDEDAAAALAAGWRIDHDDWWFRPKRDGDHNVEALWPIDADGEPILAPGAREALQFDAAMSAKPL